MKLKQLAIVTRSYIYLLKQIQHYNYLKRKIEYEKIKGDLSGLTIHARDCDIAVGFGSNLTNEGRMNIKLGKLDIEDVKKGIVAPDTHSIEVDSFTMKRGEVAIDIYSTHSTLL
jgi:hypothetical protein